MLATHVVAGLYKDFVLFVAHIASICRSHENIFKL